MTDLASLFYPHRSSFDSSISKLVPDRTIDHARLAVLLPEPLRRSPPRAALEGIIQLVSVAELMDIPLIDTPEQARDKIIYLPVLQVERGLEYWVERLLNTGGALLLGPCGDGIPAGDWPFYQAVDRLARAGRRVVYLSAFDLVDTLLWEEFRLEFRSSRLELITQQLMSETLLPALRRMGLGEPKLRLHFRRGRQGRYVSRFGLEVDFEPAHHSGVQIVYTEPIPAEPRWKTLFRRKGEKEEVFGFCLGSNDDICLNITRDYELACRLDSVPKDPARSKMDVFKEGQALMKKSRAEGEKYLLENLRTVFQAGITRPGGEFKLLAQTKPDSVTSAEILAVLIEALEWIAGRCRDNHWEYTRLYELIGRARG